VRRTASLRSSPGGLRLSLVLLASAIVFTDTVFYAAIVPLLPTYAADFDLSKTGAGILAAAYPAGTLIAALPGGWLASRIGVRPTVIVGMSTLIASSLAFAFAPSIFVLDLARFVQGLGGAASWAGAVGWLISAAPRERRGELIGSAMAAAIVGALLGPVLGGAAAALGPEVVFSSVAAAGAGLLVWAWSTPAPVAGPRTSLRMVRAALREPRVSIGMWLVFLVGLMFGTLDVLAPLRLDTLGAGASTIAATFLFAAALEAAQSPVTGRLSDRHGRLLPSLAGLAAAGVMVALLPWPAEAWLLIALVLLAAPCIGLLWSPSMAMVSDGAEARGVDQGYAVALLNLAWASGQTAGAAGGARLGEAYGDALPYLALAALCALTLLALLRPRYAAALAGS
jgi:MFS family permease